MERRPGDGRGAHRRAPHVGDAPAAREVLLLGRPLVPPRPLHARPRPLRRPERGGPGHDVIVSRHWAARAAAAATAAALVFGAASNADAAKKKREKNRAEPTAVPRPPDPN